MPTTTTRPTIVRKAGTPAMSLQRYRPLDYHVVAEMTKGSLGTMFFVLDAKKRRMAMKRVRKAETSLHDVLLEVKDLRKLQDACRENVLCLMDDVKEDAKHYYVFSEYLEDYVDLETLVARHDLGAAQVRSIALNLDACVQFMHSQGVLHCDIKPANVMVSPQTLNLRLMDFGFACTQQETDDDGPPTVPVTGSLLYTHTSLLRRMQLDGDGALQANSTSLRDADLMRNDRWALGWTIVAVLRGGHPLDPLYNHLRAIRAFYESPITLDAVTSYVRSLDDEVNQLIGKRLLEHWDS